MFGLHRVRIWIVVAVVWILAFVYLRRNPSLIQFGDQEQVPRPKKAWTRRPDKYPVEAQKLASLPAGDPHVKVPQIQAKAPSEDRASKERRLARQAAVKESFEHSWKGYSSYAWMHDEVTPYSGKYKDPFGGWAATLVDSLDTLWLMGMKSEFERAVQATTNLDFSRTKQPTINVFETTIRYLGGFLGAYELSNRKYGLLLGKAIEVGDLLMCAFDTPNRMPITRWEWRRYAGGADQVAHQQELVAEIGSMSLEFTKLSQLTGNMKYYDAIKRVSDQLETVQLDTKLPGMWPMVVDALTPAFTGTDFTLGNMADSVYEYLPKQFLLLGGQHAQPRHLYENFMLAAKKHMFWKALTPSKTPVVVSADLTVTDGSGDTPKYKPTYKAQHMSCFTGAMVGLASRVFNRPSEMELATQLTDGCVWAYNVTQLGLAPESFTFVPCGSLAGSESEKDCSWSRGKWFKEVEKQYASEFKTPASEDPKKWKKPSVQEVIDRYNIPMGMTAVNDGRYMLRPEAIESVFVMYRLTGDPEWMEKAWVMFLHIEEAARTEYGSSAVADVTKKKPAKMDSMESFWMAATLKYFYLIFSDFELISLDKWVLNTEAHPLRRPDV